jgi:hypothetical protein
MKIIEIKLTFTEWLHVIASKNIESSRAKSIAKVMPYKEYISPIFSIRRGESLSDFKIRYDNHVNNS